MSGEAAGPNVGSAEQDGWIERVLGVRIPSAGGGGGLIAGAIVEPANAARSNLRAAASRIQVSDDDDQLQDSLAALAPAFLVTMMNEPEMSTAALAPGAPVAEQDRMTDIAGLLDAVGRKLDQWDKALAEAEAAKGSLSQEEPGTPADEPTLSSYNDGRSTGEALMADVQALMDTVREQCRAVQGAAGAA